MIPYWMISVSALGAAWSLWLVRPMPRLVRISLMVPILYMAVLYAILEITTIEHSLRVDITRLGILLVMITIIINAVSVRIAWQRRKEL